MYFTITVVDPEPLQNLWRVQFCIKLSKKELMTLLRKFCRNSVFISAMFIQE